MNSVKQEIARVVKQGEDKLAEVSCRTRCLIEKYELTSDDLEVLVREKIAVEGYCLCSVYSVRGWQHLFVRDDELAGTMLVVK